MQRRRKGTKPRSTNWSPQATGYVKADFALFGYMSGFIVAMFFFREMFPDIPPFLGVFSDSLSIFLPDI